MKIILPFEKYFKTLKDMTIGTESFTTFQNGRNNNVEILAFDNTQGDFQIQLPLILILQMK